MEDANPKQGDEGNDLIPSLATRSLTTHRQLPNGVVEEDEIVFDAPNEEDEDDDGDGNHPSPRLVQFEGLPQHPPELTVETMSKEVALLEHTEGVGDAKLVHMEKAKSLQQALDGQDGTAQYVVVDDDEEEDEDGEYEYVYVWEDCSTDESVETPPIPEHVIHGEELDHSDYNEELEFDAGSVTTSSDEEDGDDKDKGEKKQSNAGKEYQHEGDHAEQNETKQVVAVSHVPLPTDDMAVDRQLDAVSQDGPLPPAPMGTIAAPHSKHDAEATNPTEVLAFHSDPNSHHENVSLVNVQGTQNTVVVPLGTIDPSLTSVTQETTDPKTMNDETTTLKEDVPDAVKAVDDPSSGGNIDVEMGTAINNATLLDVAIVHQATQELDKDIDLCLKTETEPDKAIESSPFHRTAWLQNVALFICFLLAGGVSAPIIFFLLTRR